MNTLLTIGNYELISIELDNGFCYGFRISSPQQNNKDGWGALYLHKDGTFKLLTDYTPFYDTLNEIIARFKKCLTNNCHI